MNFKNKTNYWKNRKRESESYNECWGHNAERETERGKEKKKKRKMKMWRKRGKWMNEWRRVRRFALSLRYLVRERERKERLEDRRSASRDVCMQESRHSCFFFSFSPFIIVCAVYTACSCTIGLFLEISPQLLFINTLDKISDQNYTTSPDVTSKFRFLFFSF